MKNNRDSRKVKVGLIQAKVLPDPEENLKKTLAMAEEAVGKGAQIICTQELFRSFYFCQEENHENFKLSEPIPGPSTQAFHKFAKKPNVVIIASLFEN
ncbi:MAG: nitrilase-related carbon-nitrogen hydrolase, partial [Verrucomicrobiota bacterium]